MTRFQLSLLAFSVFATVFFQAGLCSAQQNVKKCAPVTPKNPQEAVMMEQTTNKTGCWVRDPNTGQLVFISSLPPDKNYNPILNVPKTGGCKPVLGNPTTATLNGSTGMGLAGTWKTTQGIYPGEGELALSRTVGPPGSIQKMNNCDVIGVETGQVTLVRTPDGRFCDKGVPGQDCFVPKGLGSYVVEDDAMRCNFILNGAVLRGACFDKVDTGRVTLYVATRVSP